MAISQVPPECRLLDSDASLIRAYKEPLLGLGAELVQRFYDTLYTHPTTGAIFVDGERPDRELTLSHWWRRTVIGPLNDQYFAWMAMVGLVHVSRRVGNPMMLAMINYVSSFVAEKAAAMELDPLEATALVEAFERLAATVSAVIAYGYDRAYDRAVVTALFDLAGMPETLFQRIREQEVVTALAQARAEMG